MCDITRGRRQSLNHMYTNSAMYHLKKDTIAIVAFDIRFLDYCRWSNRTCTNYNHYQIIAENMIFSVYKHRLTYAMSIYHEEVLVTFVACLSLHLH